MFGKCMQHQADIPEPSCLTSAELALQHLSAGTRPHRMTGLPAGQASGSVTAQRPYCHYNADQLRLRSVKLCSMLGLFRGRAVSPFNAPRHSSMAWPMSQITCCRLPVLMPATQHIIHKLQNIKYLPDTDWLGSYEQRKSGSTIAVASQTFWFVCSQRNLCLLYDKPASNIRIHICVRMRRCKSSCSCMPHQMSSTAQHSQHVVQWHAVGLAG